MLNISSTKEDFFLSTVNDNLLMRQGTMKASFILHIFISWGSLNTGHNFTSTIPTKQ